MNERSNSETMEQMNKAIQIMKECGADSWVERYEKELVEMSQQNPQ